MEKPHQNIAQSHQEGHNLPNIENGARFEFHSESDINSEDVHRNPASSHENDAILAALSSDIAELKKASLALKNEVHEDLSLIQSVLTAFSKSNDQLQRVVSEVGKLSRINTWSPIFLLFGVVFVLIFILYIMSWFKRAT